MVMELRLFLHRLVTILSYVLAFFISYVCSLFLYVRVADPEANAWVIAETLAILTFFVAPPAFVTLTIGALLFLYLARGIMGKQWFLLSSPPHAIAWGATLGILAMALHRVFLEILSFFRGGTLLRILYHLF